MEWNFMRNFILVYSKQNMIVISCQKYQKPNFWDIFDPFHIGLGNCVFLENVGSAVS